jgi:hypothetical protein
LDDGRVYLKGGVYETNVSTYPLANVETLQIGLSFSVAAEDIRPFGVTWDGTAFWVAGDTSNRVYKYNSAGVYTNTNFSVASQTTAVRGVTWDGTYFWVMNNSGVVYKYNSAGVYQSVNWTSDPEATTPSDLEWDGTGFVVSDSSGKSVHKYTSAGVFVATYDVSSVVSVPYGVTFDGTYYWVVDIVADIVYKYNSSFVYQDESFSVTNFDTTPYSLGYDGANIIVAGGTNDLVGLFTHVIGVGYVASLGGQNYMRVA